MQKKGFWLASMVFLLAASLACFGAGEKEQSSVDSDETVTLTYLYPLGSGFQVVESMADNVVIKAVNEIKNVNIDFIHPPQGQENEQFNLILASGDLPDMLTHGWGIPQKYPGGAAKAISDDVYIPLNDLMDEYAPNLKRIVTEYDNVRKDITTDAGHVWGFPMIDKTVQPQWMGPTIRKDLFDKAGLEVPETIGEWYDALTYFVDHSEVAPGMEAPLIMDSSGMGSFFAFMSAYDVSNDFFQIDGKVLYGPLQPGFKDYLVEMNKWYEEGLIHPDFAAGLNRGAYITTGKAVALMSGGFWEFDGWKISSENPDFRVVGAPYPSLKKGEKVHISYMARRSHLGYHTPVTSACENPERAVDWMDWFYSEEGSLKANWGVEGEDWERDENGARMYTDKIAKNTEGVSIPIIYFKYLYSHGAFLREWDRELPSYGQDAKESGDIWLGSTLSDHMIATFTSITADESNEYTGIMGDVTTYVREMTVKFIAGEESFSDYDKFASTIQRMNIDRATEIKQASLDRFNKR